MISEEDVGPKRKLRDLRPFAARVGDCIGTCASGCVRGTAVSEFWSGRGLLDGSGMEDIIDGRIRILGSSIACGACSCEIVVYCFYGMRLLWVVPKVGVLVLEE